MLLEHVAAILFFAGPLFYLGLWMAIAPTDVASVVELLMRRGNRASAGAPKPAPNDSSLRTAVRCAGVVLVLFAIAV